jgi:hypothetical protein
MAQDPCNRPTSSQGTTCAGGATPQALANALGEGQRIHFVGDPAQTQVPAIYDVRKLGVRAAMRSLFELRQWLGRDTRAGDIRLFDQVGWRERILAGRARPQGLPAAPNIYGAYTGYFSEQGHRLAALAAPPRPGGLGTALVVPASRIASKALSAQVIAGVVSRLSEGGYEPQVIVLEGEQVELPAGVARTRLPRSFDALIGAVRGAALVVSADSLAAHLGEFHGKPTFVVTPRPNEYWLPETAFNSNGWCTFDNLSRLSAWLRPTSAAVQTPPRTS